MAVNVRE
jgi:hypothetical protein